ncbi:MAG: type II secretion system F family protein [Gammaproteobacteria bacterium]|nr:type II secretion system F family protein [Gammaproteobacteria bacterium]MBU2675791.1 type II secretion system F family protein [Gammaproteobacteria bacterium]NNC57797.1 type II secretion system F family protein [Woeseiaceae bacterium]NNL49528.1 type II secretion system F family protein [Woeseiaceae bacterium]
MSEFAYKGRSAAGGLVTGKLDGASADAVAGRLVSIGITPVEIRDLATSTSLTLSDLIIRLGGGQPTTKDLVLFCRQMHTITRTGLPLLKGLTGLMQTTHNDVLKAALVDVISGLESGRELSKALDGHPEIFTPLFVNLVEVGEATGTLDVAFQRLYEYLSMDQEVRDRVKSAVRYPIIVLIAVAIALAIITVFVIPNFAPIFRALGDDIPMPTKIIMGVSDFAINFWPYILAAGIGMAFAASSYIKTERGRLRWDKLKLRLPVIGIIVHNAAMSRVTRSLAISISAGLPINQTLRTVSASIGNSWLGQKMASLSGDIERGESLSVTAANSALFTPLILQMIALGEETGALPELLDESSDYYKREVDYDLENLSAALEPILIVTVGAVVLILALGVFLPMWDMVARAKAG